jgi:hypothetical protein
LAAIGLAWVLAAAPAPAADNKVTFVDLKDQFNHKLSDLMGFSGRAGNYLTVPTGEQTLAGIKFKVGDGIIQLGSKAWKDKPEKVEGIKIDRKVAKLHLLHSTLFGGGPNKAGDELFVEDDTLIGEYRVHYEDKSSEVIPVVYGKDVRDWWHLKDEKGVSRGKVAWVGDSDLAKEFDCRIRLYLTTWENPKPDKKVVSVDFTAKKADTIAAPFCVAMTVEEKK